MPEKVRKNGSFGTIHTTLVDLPMSPWSTDATMRSVGKLMYADASQMPEVRRIAGRRGRMRQSSTTKPDSYSLVIRLSRPSC